MSMSLNTPVGQLYQEKESGGGPSALISIRSSRVSVLKDVSRSVFIMFRIENVCSTLLLVKGKEKRKLSP